MKDTKDTKNTKFERTAFDYPADPEDVFIKMEVPNDLADQTYKFMDSKTDIDKLTRLKRRLNQHPFLRHIINCPYRSPIWDGKVSGLIKQLGSCARILDLGSGIRRRAEHIINLEIEPMPNVNVVGDGHLLPFKDEVFDAVILEAVLEHVREPRTVISEVHRVLRPGGWVCAGVPFIQGYHGSPEDYQRYTIKGLENLFSGFQKIESGACVGATSALHWIFREYIGILFSFGNIWLYKSLSLIVGWLTFPLVYLDTILMHNKNTNNIASAVFFIGIRDNRHRGTKAQRQALEKGLSEKGY